MSERSRIRSSRRAFFTTAGAAAGASIASAAGASAMFDDAAPLRSRLDTLNRELGALEDREAIRHLHDTFVALVERQSWSAVVGLFADDATVELFGETFSGRHSGVRRLFVERFGAQQAPQVLTAFAHEHGRHDDRVEVAADRRSATACFHCRVEISAPLTENSVAAQMARMQGMSASRRWERGRFEAEYARVGNRWVIRRLRYLPG